MKWSKLWLRNTDYQYYFIHENHAEDMRLYPKTMWRFGIRRVQTVSEWIMILNLIHVNLFRHVTISVADCTTDWTQTSICKKKKKDVTNCWSLRQRFVGRQRIVNKGANPTGTSRFIATQHCFSAHRQQTLIGGATKTRPFASFKSCFYNFSYL